MCSWQKAAWLGFKAGNPDVIVGWNATAAVPTPAHTEGLLTNARLSVICGSENLAMPDPSVAPLLRAAHKVLCPTELGGMMGYLTAVEEYLARIEGVPFDIRTLLEASKKLDGAAFAATERVRAGGFTRTFEQAIT